MRLGRRFKSLAYTFCLSMSFLFLVPQASLAFRPYKTTDADVVAPGVLQIKLGGSYTENRVEDARESKVRIPLSLNVGLPRVSIFRDAEIVVGGKGISLTRPKGTGSTQTQDN